VVVAAVVGMKIIESYKVFIIIELNWICKK
jgi:hypothetical protein